MRTAALLLAVCLLGCPAPPSPPRPASAALPAETREITARTFEVVRVIDGDTFVVVYDGEPTSVRIWGIDAPELGKPGSSEAKARLESLIGGKTVTLLFPGPHKRDHFGRLLARVLVDGKDVGPLMGVPPWTGRR